MLRWCISFPTCPLFSSFSVFSGLPQTFIYSRGFRMGSSFFPYSQFFLIPSLRFLLPFLLFIYFCTITFPIVLCTVASSHSFNFSYCCDLCFFLRINMLLRIIYYLIHTPSECLKVDDWESFSCSYCSFLLSFRSCIKRKLYRRFRIVVILKMWLAVLSRSY